MIEFNVDQALAKLGDLVSKHGPQVVDFAAQVKQAEGVGNLCVSGFLLVAASACGVFAYKSYRRIARIEDARTKWREIERKYELQLSQRRYDEGARKEADIILPPEPDYVNDFDGALVLAPALVGALTGLVAIVRLIDIWDWIAAFAPKLALAHDIMQRITQ